MGACALVAGVVVPSAASTSHVFQVAHYRAVSAAPAGGFATSGAARTVNLSAAAAGPQIAVHSRAFGTLGRNGKPTGNLQSHQGANALVKQKTGLSGGPLTAPPITNLNFTGSTLANATCNCQPPDVNAATSGPETVETVNLHMHVFNTPSTGGVSLRSGVSLNTFLGTSQALSDPRVQWDNVNHRFSLVVIPIPNPGQAPAEYVAASKTSDASGAWFVYHLTFSGGPFQPGTLLDYPYIGQDRVSILSSSNNFATAAHFGTYTGSSAFAMPKSKIYNGLGFSFPAFNVSFSTAPVEVGGIPMQSTSTTYWLSSVPGFGYSLYQMPTNNGSGAAGAISLRANVPSAFNAPSRRVNQPGTSQTLDPLDGRIVWAPTQIGNWVWFTHGIDDGGFPTVRYGAINLAATAPNGSTSRTATGAGACRKGTSDDFNPSIGVSNAGSNDYHVWLNWAYTDSPHGIPTSDTINGVLPGQGVPNELGTDHTMITGGITGEFRFGDYSSVSIDPSVTNGTTAVSAQEYFVNGAWATRIVRSSF